MSITYDQTDLSALEFWGQPARIRDEAFAELRRSRPVSFHRSVTFGLSSLMPGDDRGFWAVATHELVRLVSRAPERFCSSEGVSMESVPSEINESVTSFLTMDGARHQRLRHLVSSAFTPRNVARIEAQIAVHAREIVDRLVAIGDCDFVQELSMQLPMWTISDMIGVDPQDRERIASAANAIVAANDPEFVDDAASSLDAFFEGQRELSGAAMVLAQDRRARGRDDLMTALVEAEVDGEVLTDEEIGAFMVLLAVAGNDTTRQTTSHGMKALCDNPDQRAYLIADLAGRVPDAVEEMIRWATPVMQFRRTATEDVVLGEQQIRAGEKVVLLYISANRDEAVFHEPWKFDVARRPNEHLGFGGGGPHYCLGTHLARVQLRSIFTELLTRLPQLEVGDPDYLVANFIHGIKRMPCSW